jgi:hypothetical protein
MWPRASFTPAEPEQRETVRVELGACGIPDALRALAEAQVLQTRPSTSFMDDVPLVDYLVTPNESVDRRAFHQLVWNNATTRERAELSEFVDTFDANTEAILHRLRAQTGVTERERAQEKALQDKANEVWRRSDIDAAERNRLILDEFDRNVRVECDTHDRAAEAKLEMEEAERVLTRRISLHANFVRAPQSDEIMKERQAAVATPLLTEFMTRLNLGAASTASGASSAPRQVPTRAQPPPSSSAAAAAASSSSTTATAAAAAAASVDAMDIDPPHQTTPKSVPAPAPAPVPTQKAIGASAATTSTVSTVGKTILTITHEKWNRVIATGILEAGAGAFSETETAAVAAARSWHRDKIRDYSAKCGALLVRPGESRVPRTEKECEELALWSVDSTWHGPVMMLVTSWNAYLMDTMTSMWKNREDCVLRMRMRCFEVAMIVHAMPTAIRRVLLDECTAAASGTPPADSKNVGIWREWMDIARPDVGVQADWNAGMHVAVTCALAAAVFKMCLVPIDPAFTAWVTQMQTQLRAFKTRVFTRGAAAAWKKCAENEFARVWKLFAWAVARDEEESRHVRRSNPGKPFRESDSTRGELQQDTAARMVDLVRAIHEDPQVQFTRVLEDREDRDPVHWLLTYHRLEPIVDAAVDAAVEDEAEDEYEYDEVEVEDEGVVPDDDERADEHKDDNA